MASRKHRIGKPSKVGPLFLSPKEDALSRFIDLRKRMLAAGLDDGVDLELLQACGKPPEKRKVPPAGANLVYDRHYADLRMRGLIVKHAVYPGQSSFSDYYVLTPAGRKLLSGKDES